VRTTAVTVAIAAAAPNTEHDFGKRAGGVWGRARQRCGAVGAPPQRLSWPRVRPPQELLGATACTPCALNMMFVPVVANVTHAARFDRYVTALRGLGAGAGTSSVDGVHDGVVGATTAPAWGAVCAAGLRGLTDDVEDVRAAAANTLLVCFNKCKATRDACTPPVVCENKLLCYALLNACFVPDGTCQAALPVLSAGLVKSVLRSLLPLLGRGASCAAFVAPTATSETETEAPEAAFRSLGDGDAIDRNLLCNADRDDDDGLGELDEAHSGEVIGLLAAVLAHRGASGRDALSLDATSVRTANCASAPRAVHCTIHHATRSSVNCILCFLRCLKKK